MIIVLGFFSQDFETNVATDAIVMSKIRRFVWGVICFTIAFTAAQAIECTGISPKDGPKELIELLKTKQREMTPECTSWVIRRLGALRAVSSSEVVADFLDFERPESDRERAGVADPHDKFPAVPALVSLGQSAVPPLTHKLQHGQISERARENAIRSIVLIYAENPTTAIRVLKEAAKKSGSQEEAVRLESSARDAVRFCGKSWKDRCETTLSGSN